MKGFALIICWLLATYGFGQGSTVSVKDLTLIPSEEGFTAFISSVKGKKSHDLRLVKTLFNKAHQDFLKNYKAYSQVEDIFEKGNYDCLSGTYFLTRALDDIGLEYKIFETNYHIFLMVQTQRGEIMLESTDPINGFTTNKEAITEKIARYQQVKRSAPGTQLYLSDLRMFHELRADQLPGLLYFNKAVEAFHSNDLKVSCAYLEQAWKIYDNQRIEFFTPILIQTIAASTLDKSDKEKLTNLLQTHHQSATLSLVSR